MNTLRHSFFIPVTRTHGIWTQRKLKLHITTEHGGSVAVPAPKSRGPKFTSRSVDRISWSCFIVLFWSCRCRGYNIKLGFDRFLPFPVHFISSLHNYPLERWEKKTLTKKPRIRYFAWSGLDKRGTMVDWWFARENWRLAEKRVPLSLYVPWRKATV